MQGPVPFKPPKSLVSGAGVKRIPHGELLYPKALPKYGEPAWVTDLVKEGKLPPVEQRLPKTPVVTNTSKAPDGPGQYGGVLRHVTGDRPQGWNWLAGLHQGWGGLTMTTQICLVNTGPMWQLTPEKIEPLPSLATSWEWSQDGRQLTMHLLEGAKWSDGDPFDADDVMFTWEDNISDPKVPARLKPQTLGPDTKLEKIDAATVRWTFSEPFAVSNLYKMAYINFCPGPSHILKPLHPKHNPSATYESYINALPPGKLPWVTMGPWTATAYKPDEFIVFRRNPYYWQVDEQGNQLPYLDEVQWKLSSWADRDVQTLAGRADYTNLENPSIYLEAMKKAQEPGFPNSVHWGPRSLSWRADLNLSTVCGVRSDRDRAIRDLNRKLEFRRAISQAVDREAMGQSLARGPFTHPHPGGLHPETEFFSADSVVFYPYSPKTSKALLAQLGFEDGNGDGIVEWPDGPMKGGPLEFTLAYTTLRTTDPSLADSMIAMLREVGIKAVPKPLTQGADVARQNCEWDMMIERSDREFQVPAANLDFLAPLASNMPEWHQGTAEKPQELLPFEQEVVKIVRAIRAERDSNKRNELLRQYNKLVTENVYHVGLITAAAALIINKDMKNVPPGTPVLAYQWGELGTMRERFWVPKAQQAKVPELFPGKLPTPGLN